MVAPFKVLKLSTACVLAGLQATSQVWANSDTDTSFADESLEYQYSISVGAGGKVKPEYFGSDDYELSAVPVFDVRRFYIPGLGQVVDGKSKQRGFSIYPSFSFIGEREASDSVDLTGTNTIDWAFEAGLGIQYRYDWIRTFAEFRQGFNGHDGQTGTLGMDFTFEPADRTTLVFGPRINWGSNDFMDTYFGVTAAEAAAPGSLLAVFDPGSGFNSAGVEMRMSYEWNDRTTLHFDAGWERLINDAADSPIVRLGDEDQFSVGVGISYRFDFNLFDQ